MFYNLLRPHVRDQAVLAHLFQVCFAVVVLMIIATVSTEADLSDPTLSVYYSFDEDGDTLKDGSIYGNDGTIEGKSKREKGVIDKAIVLEPNTWIDMNGPEFENVPLEGLTIAVWVNHTGSPDPQSIFDSIGTDHASGLYHVEIRPAGFRFFHRNGAEQQVFNINPGPVIKDGKWVHFTGTYDSKSGDAKTYIDGKVTHEAKGNGDLSDNWGVQAEIGHHKNSRWFDGLMDEFYMFARALSEDEIKEVMDGEFLSVEPTDKLATTWGSLKARR